jgi:hypothetical protein
MKKGKRGMPHVSDGEIHAYLDGALDLFPPEEAARVRDHVGSCADCAARLNRERTIRDRADSILAQTDPASVPPPPFEELRGRARIQTSVPGKARRLSPAVLAWAASIVLALGTGWGIRDRLLVDPALAPRPAADEAVATPQVARRALAEETESRGETEGRTSVGVAALYEAVAPEETADDRSDVLSYDSTDRPLDDERAARETAVAAEPSNEGAGAVDQRGERGAIAEREQGIESLDMLPSSRARQASALAGQDQLSLARRVPPEAPTGSGLMVPDLQVRSVETEPWPGAPGVIRVVQILPGGEPLELLFVSASPGQGRADGAYMSADQDPASGLPAAPDGWNRAVVSLNGGWLVVQAPVEPDSLTALVSRLY